MNLTSTVWKRLALACVTAGICALALAAVGYIIGVNYGGGARIQSNFVPYSLFAGVGLLLFTGMLVLLKLPEFLPPAPAKLGALLLAAAVLFFALVSLKQIREMISVRADILSWAESPFVDNIIRFRAGHPQFTPPEDANSYGYPPSAPLLTYAIASAVGRPTSIPTYRFIQQIYLLIAAWLAAAAARDLLRLARPDSRLANWWLLCWVPAFYLVAVNPTTNFYVPGLHNDALAVMSNALGFWLLMRLVATGDNRWLLPMAALPALAYFAKQVGLIWLPLYLLYFILSARLPVRRLLIFCAASLACVAAMVGGCYLLWGQPYLFWTFRTLGVVHISLSESFQQLSASGWYVTMGLLGGMILLRGAAFARLFPVWATWLLHLLATTYTSGIAFRPHYFGPVSLTGAVWFLAAVATVWPESSGSREEAEVRRQKWLQMIFIGAGVVLLFISSGLLRIGDSAPRGLEQYLRQIEKEFDGVSPDRVLLDMGSWVYLRQNVVMKDRASVIGFLRGTRAGELTMTLARIRAKQYEKILVRTSDKEFPVSRMYMEEGMRRALAENYQPVRTIKSPGRPPSWWLFSDLLLDVAVLEPIRGQAPNP